MVTRSKTTKKAYPRRKVLYVLASIVGIVVLFQLFAVAYSAYYHRDDMRDRPINSSFEYLGRNYSSGRMFGLISTTAPLESFYYGTDIKPTDIASALPGFEVVSPASDFRSPTSPTVVLRKKGQAYGSDLKYLTKDDAKQYATMYSFPLKQTNKKYIVDITENLMYDINPSNLEPSVTAKIQGR